jgi:hypothetical protein
MSLRYTFRLKPERDSDLIEWLNSLGEGERSCFIRHALRKALRQKEDVSFVHQEKEKDNLYLKQSSDSSTLPNSNAAKDTNTDLNTLSIENKLDQLTNVF